MTLVVLPFRPNPGELEDVTQIMLDFDAILAVLNGGITSDNIAPGGLDAPTVIGPTLQQQLVPPGAIMPFAGASAPAGFLTCDGTSYATTAHPKLFEAIQYGYGGSGGQFNVPNFRGRVLVMEDSGQAEFTPMGKGSGPAKALAGHKGLQAHNHVVGQNPHGHGVSQSPHAHGPYPNVGGGQYVSTKNSFNGPHSEALQYAGPEGPQDLWFAPTTADAQANIGIIAGNADISIGNAGGGDSQNLQPYVVVNYIIKT